VLPSTNLFYTIDFELERDPWGNYKNFEIIKIEDIDMSTIDDAMFTENAIADQDIVYPVYGLYFRA
jgi:hypothetical protein